ncbi:DMT family transporter [Ureibacillus sp. FSL K6-8385]|uniref:DMT family transporter n=1 Tax=Ureibacillus terrenus TaxID=118246 RepID=A0A540UZ80_9BACL|nr:DMT family transporter [Ureibacillus terrenus]MED3662116.1 DMT family transporter [Ureibacillus terrenus]MED3764470.1 DMT family transporter [Ureibacillus terrenus]TQE89764.1 DMT family transporter [Ureibacillus terrenus]
MKSNFLYPILILTAAGSYGILSTIIKIAMEVGFTADEAVTSQYLIGFCLSFLLLFMKKRRFPKFRKKDFITLLFAGIFTGTTGIVYGKSLNYLPASLAVVLLFQFTWIGMLIDCLLRKRWPSRPEAASLVLLFAGTIFASGLVDADLSGIRWQGWFFGFCSAFSFAIFLQINSKSIEGIATIERTFFTSFFALIMISIFLSPEIVWNGILIREGLWKFGLALGFFGTIIPIFLLAIAVPKVGGGLTSILSAMELPVAVFASVIVLHEPFSWLQVIGIVLILTGIALPTIFSEKQLKFVRKTKGSEV